MSAGDGQGAAGSVEVGRGVANLLIKERHGVGVGEGLDGFGLPAADDGEDGFEHARLPWYAVNCVHERTLAEI